ncbi:hypothetical protein EVAR_32855_1 [Eumeta japonica]|uniref:Uncharacterized protein n=1 Tax=Eumeta variegata TaxID=151549 RepID=A0A4C1WBM6_EUMVA|nr:hypothetical protein EVAR_32855_1 [Eumeta japonica]
MVGAGRARKESFLGYAKGNRFLNHERRGRAAPRRPRSTLTSAQLRGNRDERPAKSRSILQSSEEVTDGNVKAQASELNTIHVTTINKLEEEKKNKNVGRLKFLSTVHR